MQQYLDLIQHILNHGEQHENRTGIDSIDIFGWQMHFDISTSFPLLTTRKLHLKSIIYELLWFIQGQTNIRFLQENGVSIWNEWADQEGELGPVYGKQWRNWQGVNGKPVDQLQDVVAQIRLNPRSRRLLVSSWNVAELQQMALPPCHLLFQFHVGDNGLSCQLYQRSADVFLGLPFNIASYALLTMMVAQVSGLRAHKLIISLGNAHLYTNHLQQTEELLSRQPLPPPMMRINPEVEDLFAFTYSDFTLQNYQAHPAISAPVAV